MGQRVSFRTVSDLAPPACAAIEADAREWTRDHAWWGETPAVRVDGGAVSLTHKPFTVNEFGITDRDNDFMLYRDLVAEARMLARWSAEHGAVWHTACDGEAWGEVSAAGPDARLRARLAALAELGGVSGDEAADAGRADEIHHLYEDDDPPL